MTNNQKKMLEQHKERDTGARKKSGDLLHKIAPLPGSVCVQYMRCGRSNCKCSQGKPHGPYYVRFWYENGQPRKKYVKKSEFQAISAACLARKREQHEQRAMLRQAKQQWNDALYLLRSISRGGFNRV